MALSSETHLVRMLGDGVHSFEEVEAYIQYGESVIMQCRWIKRLLYSNGVGRA